MRHFLCCLLLIALSPGHDALAQPATHLRLDDPTIQKKLAKRPKPAKGSFDLAFDFYDGPDPNKALLIGSESQFAVPLRQGRFAITLAIPPSLRHHREIWLNIQAAPGGTDHYVNLSQRNLPVKSATQKRVSARLRVSGTILVRQGTLVLGPYETVWLLPKNKTTRIAQKKPTPRAESQPRFPATVLERIQQDLGLSAGQFMAHASLGPLWPLERFPLHGGNQLLQLMRPDNGAAVDTLPESLLFLLEIPDRDAQTLETLLHREEGFSLELEFSDRSGEQVWLSIQLESVQLLEVHRLDPDLYSLRIHPGDMDLHYHVASTRPLRDTQAPEPAG